MTHKSAKKEAKLLEPPVSSRSAAEPPSELSAGRPPRSNFVVDRHATGNPSWRLVRVSRLCPVGVRFRRPCIFAIRLGVRIDPSRPVLPVAAEMQASLAPAPVAWRERYRLSLPDFATAIIVEVASQFLFFLFLPLEIPTRRADSAYQRRWHLRARVGGA